MMRRRRLSLALFTPWLARTAARRGLRSGALALAFALVVSVAPSAHAGDSAAAEALFVDGRALLQAKKYDEACPKLAESQRLDPATGTLLALALCYEGQGKVASAWAAYVEAASRSHDEKNAARESAAKERVAALEPKLPRLLLSLAPGADKPAGLTIQRDGAPVGEGTLGTAIPVDPGEHTVYAIATGKQPFTRTIRVAEGETQRLAIGPLVDAASPAEKDDAKGRPSFFTPVRTAGVAVGALGIVGLGVAGGLTGAAASKNAESNKDCNGNVCGPVGLPLRKEARSFGDGATATLIAGGVLAAAGVVLVIVGGPKSSGSGASAVVPFVSPDGAGAIVRGSF